MALAELGREELGVLPGTVEVAMFVQGMGWDVIVPSPSQQSVGQHVLLTQDPSHSCFSGSSAAPRHSRDHWVGTTVREGSCSQ